MYKTLPPVSARARTLHRDLIEFRHTLRLATPHAAVTVLLILACLAVFTVMVASGVPLLWPSATDMVQWGANAGTRVILRHQYWRLIASVFVHGGLLHLVVNMWSLLVIGPLVERLYGNLMFAVLYLAAGIGGAIASVAASPVRVSVGASGAIMGVLGALLAFLIKHRRSITPSVVKLLRNNAVGIVVFMAILGTVISDIDQAAHLGGFATGFVGGFFLSRPCPVISGRWLIVRHVVMVVMVAGALTITAAAITLRAQSILPPVVRLRDLQEQIKPAVEEFQSIGAQFPSISALERQHATPASRTAGTQPIAVLIERGTANRARLLRVSTPDPGLKTIVANLIEAQSEQIRRLHAARRFLDGEGNDDLSGPNGVRMGRSATIQAIRAFQDQKRRYLSEPHALTDQNKPR